MLVSHLGTFFFPTTYFYVKAYCICPCYTEKKKNVCATKTAPSHVYEQMCHTRIHMCTWMHRLFFFFLKFFFKFPSFPLFMDGNSGLAWFLVKIHFFCCPSFLEVGGWVLTAN